MAGVSEATISRVFNGVGPLREETKRRVEEAAKALNYHPHAIAQNFARRRSGNLGVILPFLPKIHLFSTYYFSEILSGIGQKVKEMGYDLLLFFRSPDEEIDYSAYYLARKVDACIILGARNTEQEITALRILKQHSLPFCLVNQRFDGESFNEVDADHVTGSKEAVKHLIERGFHKIAFLNGPEVYSNSRDRFLGYQIALEEAGIPFDKSLVFYGNYSRKSGILAAAQIAGHRASIDALFAANDRMAIGLIQGLKEQGVFVGRDLAMVGYDDSDAALVADPQLTSVHVPFYEMGQSAAEVLLKTLKTDGESTACRTVLPTELVIRASSIG